MGINKYENALKENREFSVELALLISDTSRKVCLMKKETSKHHQTIWNTGANVIGPVFFLFVLWLLREAKKVGLKRLYFVSRDGQILLKIAKIICKNLGYNFELRYLNVSRKSLYLPSLTEKVKSELDWIKKRELQSVSILEICKRVNISPISIKTELEKYGFSQDVWKNKLNNREIKKAKKCFKEKSIQKIINENEKKSLENTIGYLKQEKIVKNFLDFGVVDIGWTGRSLALLNIILQKNGYGDSLSLKGFYFGLWPDIKTKNRMISFITSPKLTKMIKYMNNRVIIEIFSSADHGMVTTYKKENSKYIPVLSSLGIREIGQWGILTQQASILKFVEEFTKNIDSNIIEHKDSELIVGKLLSNFLSNPSYEEANVYGKYYFSEKETEDDFMELAPFVTFKQILLWMFGFKSIDKNLFFWLNGSLKRSNLKHSWLLIFLIKTKLLIKRMNFITFLILIKIGLINIVKFLFPTLVEKLKIKLGLMNKENQL